MLGRIFGRGKDDSGTEVCTACGRTLLAGEWTQRVGSADDDERLVCSLCAPAYSGEADLEPAVPAAANNGRIRESRAEARSESDAFWRAFKEKDAQIADLQAQLARSEAEKQELAGQLARQRAQAADASALAAAAEEPEAAPTEPETTDADVMAAAEAPGEFAAEMAALHEELAAVDASPAVSENTQPLPALSDEQVEAAAHQVEDAVAPESEATGPATSGESGPAPAGAEETAAEAPAEAARAAVADVEAEAASLTLLQRSVDLLNVSKVPAKIAETNEQLGMPSVHVGFDGQTVAVTFMWSMGWYRFLVDRESGAVSLADRGYDELEGVQPNAGVRADGSVMLAPAQISRAATQRVAPAPPQPTPAERPGEPESPRVVAQKPPEILSKSLLGQRSDDEPSTWDQTKARDFNWDR